jgi:formate hydrogenlyase subunit 4
VAVIWFGFIRKLVSPATARRLYRTTPMVYISPMVLSAIALVIAVVSWDDHRYAAYGALLCLVVAVFISLLIGRQRAPVT